MPHWRTMMDRDYLGAWDFPTEKTGTITEVTQVKLPGTGKIKANKRPIIALKGTEKRLVVNATIGKAIESMYGADTDKWIGKRITMYASTCRAADGSGQIECVRVRPTVPKGPGEPIPSQPVDGEIRARQVANAEAMAGETGRVREPGEDDE